LPRDEVIEFLGIFFWLRRKYAHLMQERENNMKIVRDTIEIGQFRDPVCET